MFGHSATVLCVFVNLEESLDRRLIWGSQHLAALEHVAARGLFTVSVNMSMS